MHVYLLARVHWGTMQHLCHRLHHLSCMRHVYNGHALQQPRSVSDFERSQHRMHVYLLYGVHWNGL